MGVFWVAVAYWWAMRRESMRCWMVFGFAGWLGGPTPLAAGGGVI